MPACQDVLAGRSAWGCEPADALTWLRALPDRAAALVFTSPPFEDRRGYDGVPARRGQDWVDWLRPVVAEAARVSAGLVVVNAAGPVRGRSYSPAVEWLVADLTRRDGLACGPAPWCWDKGTGTPGSDGRCPDKYQRRDWEPLYAFARPDRLPLAWTDAAAFGRPPTSAAPGRRRVRKRGRAGADRLDEQHYAPPAVANPGNVIRAPVGGRHPGSRFGRGGEAPMPLRVAERLVCWYCPPGGVVADPFAGTGTTLHAALQHGRRFVGCDVRASQVRTCERRARTVTPNLVPA